MSNEFSPSTYQALVSDEGAGGFEKNAKYFDAIDKWAQENCESYLGYHVTDVSDASLIYDEIGAYEFSDAKDLVLFKLRWCK